MSANSSIEWTDRTWNPVRGCSVISPGCVNCYAMKFAHRFSADGKPYAGLTKQTKAGPQWTGKIRTVDEALLEPLSWRKPQRVFVNSMSDLFHEAVPDGFIDRVFAVMALAPQHTFQVLTKRADRMRDYMARACGRIADAIQPLRTDDRRVIVPLPHGVPGRQWWPLPNVWLGVSVEDQKHADERIPQLLQTPAAVRFASAEPLLGPVDLREYLDGREEHGTPFSEPPARTVGGCIGWTPPIDWVIVGGESGPGARPFNVEWAKSIVRQCKAANVACFIKQMGSVITGLGLSGPPYSSPPRREGFLVHWTCDGDNTFGLCDRKGGNMSEWPEDLRVREFPLSQEP